METNRSACFSFLALSKVAEYIPLLGEMAHRAKMVAAAAERGWQYILLSPKLRGKWHEATAE